MRVNRYVGRKGRRSIRMAVVLDEPMSQTEQISEEKGEKRFLRNSGGKQGIGRGKLKETLRKGFEKVSDGRQEGTMRGGV